MYVENIEGLQDTLFGADYEITQIFPCKFLFKSSGKRACKPVEEIHKCSL